MKNLSALVIVLLILLVGCKEDCTKCEETKIVIMEELGTANFQYDTTLINKEFCDSDVIPNDTTITAIEGVFIVVTKTSFNCD